MRIAALPWPRPVSTRAVSTRAVPTRAVPLGLALVAVLVLGGAPAGAAYQASVYSNKTAFTSCNGTWSTIPSSLRALAADGFAYLGYAPSTFEGAAFTKSRVLSRVGLDQGFYVHSHGDHYSVGWGFREDNGTCTQGVVSAAEIAARRTKAANLVIASTCHLAEAASNFPDAFGIERLKSKPNGTGYRGPEFFMGYVGTAWTVDMLAFETNFWAKVKSGRNLGDAFVEARAMTAWRYATVPDWYGTYSYSGSPSPVSPCPSCL